MPSARFSLDTYSDISPPSEMLHTDPVSKPQPDKGPLDIFEVDLLDTSGTPGNGVEYVALFSGGDDSLVATHYAMENGLADIVVHLNTGSSIPANISYVRRVCEKYQWPLVILESPMSLALFGYRYGFPGSTSAEHNKAFQYFKGRQLARFYKARDGSVKFISGVRKHESARRIRHVKGAVNRESSVDGGNFDGWWLNVVHDFTDDDIAAYRAEHDLPQNPVAKKVHRSGDCQCFSYGNRQEELLFLEAEYPEFYQWLMNVERRVQEYRGRLAILRETHPTVTTQLDTLRKQTRPHPLRLSLLQDTHPGIFNEIATIDVEEAIIHGQAHEYNWLGHASVPSEEFRALKIKADDPQQTVCEDCNESCPAPSDFVHETAAQAADIQTEPAELVDTNAQPAQKQLSLTDLTQ